MVDCRLDLRGLVMKKTLELALRECCRLCMFRGLVGKSLVILLMTIVIPVTASICAHPSNIAVASDANMFPQSCAMEAKTRVNNSRLKNVHFQCCPLPHPPFCQHVPPLAPVSGVGAIVVVLSVHARQRRFGKCQWFLCWWWRSIFLFVRIQGGAVAGVMKRPEAMARAPVIFLSLKLFRLFFVGAWFDIFPGPLSFESVVGLGHFLFFLFGRWYGCQSNDLGLEHSDEFFLRGADAPRLEQDATVVGLQCEVHECLRRVVFAAAFVIAAGLFNLLTKLFAIYFGVALEQVVEQVLGGFTRAVSAASCVLTWSLNLEMLLSAVVVIYTSRALRVSRMWAALERELISALFNNTLR